MKSQPTKQEAAREIAEECRAIYEEICDLQKHFGWTQKQLCKRIAAPIRADYRVDYVGESEEETAERLHAKFKKMFQRKNWECNKATGRTLEQLKQLRNAIYHTDAYRRSELHESEIPLGLRKAMSRASKELHQWLVDSKE